MQLIIKKDTNGFGTSFQINEKEVFYINNQDDNEIKHAVKHVVRLIKAGLIKINA